MSQITHKLDDKDIYRQVVTPLALKTMLDRSGDNYDRPDHFTDQDEWFVFGQFEIGALLRDRREGTGGSSWQPASGAAGGGACALPPGHEGPCAVAKDT